MKRLITSNGFSLIDSQGEEVITIAEQFNENICNVSISGNIGYEHSKDISDELYALLSVGIDIVLDIDNVAFISDSFSSDLVHLEAHAEMTGHDSIPIHNMNKEVYEALKRNYCISSLDYRLKEE